MNDFFKASNLTHCKTYVGIDNGFSGAVTALLPDETILCKPVHFIDLGKEKLMDIELNRAILREIVVASGNTREKVVAVYEQCNPNPKFGARNNFTNGKNGEFWRILLSLEQIPFMVVNPQVWQKAVFRGIRGDDTKAMASLVRQQRFPHFQTNGYNREQTRGINDALCIALWARQENK